MVWLKKDVPPCVTVGQREKGNHSGKTADYILIFCSDHTSLLECLGVFFPGMKKKKKKNTGQEVCQEVAYSVL